jgi:histidyl-tRNA synthetase
MWKGLNDMVKPRTLSGFMENLPAPQVQMELMMEILRKTYSLYGFTPLDTPIIEDFSSPERTVGLILDALAKSEELC